MSGMGELVNKCSACLELGHLNQMATQTVHGAQLAARVSSCETCVEKSKEKVRFSESEYHKSKNSSFAHSVINMVGMLIGLGQLSTPYALEKGGWCSTFILVGLGVACAYTSHLLGKCLQEDASSKSYQDIGEQAFGKRGRIIASTFIYLEIFFALVSYTISLSDNLSLVFASTRIELPQLHLSTTQILTVIAVLVALPSLWLQDLSSISFLSFGGILMSLLIFSTVGTIAVFGGVKANKTIPVLQLSNIPEISGLYLFSYAGHIVFPNIYKAMKDPSKFTKVSITSFALVTALYSALSFLGAKLFGPSVSSQITLKHAAPPSCHQDRALGHNSNSHDQIRPRVRPLRHPARTQPPALDELPNQNAGLRRCWLGAAITDPGARPLLALLRARSRPHGLSRQLLHLLGLPLRLLPQDLLASCLSFGEGA